MKCPCCGKDMTAGFVQSGRAFYFKENQKKSIWGNIAEKDDILLSTNNWYVPTAAAYHCNDCKKVVIDYSAKTE